MIACSETWRTGQVTPFVSPARCAGSSLTSLRHSPSAPGFYVALEVALLWPTTDRCTAGARGVSMRR